MAETFGAFYIGFVILGIAVAVAWIFVPFAILGTKPILRDILSATREQNRLLTILTDKVAPTAPLTSKRD